MDKIYDTKDLLLKTMQSNDFSFDIYFRVAVIDNYLHDNVEKVWKLYDKMQRIRCNSIREIPIEMANHKQAFIDLINSFKLNGYDYEKPILINENGLIIDGAHRMACAIYFGIHKISTYTSEKYCDFIPADYSVKWFIENDLLDCVQIGYKQKRIIKEKWNV